EIENMRPVIRYIFDRREQKIMTGAIRAARSSKLKLENTTKEEQELFESIKTLLKKRRTFLEDVIETNEKETTTTPIDKKEDKIQKEILEATTDNENTEKEDSEDDIEFIKIEILESISEFVAEDLESYGPWNPGEIVASPKKVANIFVKANKAKFAE
ncbi:MAG: hypothetical protein KAS12_05890, partial [Candidatus Aenigmarchaeota archaeon]|nr:hypothetical protein [Candidatus Aenigmarchaeota archaeon]